MDYAFALVFIREKGVGLGAVECMPYPFGYCFASLNFPSLCM